MPLASSSSASCHVTLGTDGFRHTLPSRVDQLLRALRKAPASAGGHPSTSSRTRGDERNSRSAEHIFIRQQFGDWAECLLKCPPRSPGAMRPFLVSLNRDFVFRRLELLLGFSFLRFTLSAASQAVSIRSNCH